MTFATLRALHTVIGDALAEMERVYQDSGHPQDGFGNGSLDYPSLDTPYYSTAPHTAEEEAAERRASDPAVVGAANRIVAACGQLAASVHRPFFSLVEGVKSGHLAACLQFLEASNTVEILRAAGSDGLHVNAIARRIEELNVEKNGSLSSDPVDAGKLSHILRFLATYHWMREVRPDVFANNRLSALIDSGKTLQQLRNAQEKYDNTDGIAAFVAMTADEFFKSIAFMTDALLPSQKRSVSLRALLDSDRTKSVTPQAAVKYRAPFNLAFRTELGYFEWLELPENKSRLREFGRAMTGTRAWEVAENILGAFPWKDLQNDSVVVDVGGGIGSTSIVLAQAYPHLWFVVQDREQVVKIAPTVWGSSHADLLNSGRVTFLAHNFFTAQPPTLEIEGAGSVSSPSVFLIRGCTHNWPDEDVRKMFRLLRDAATSITKLLIVDVILPLACYDDTEDDTEPIPGAERTLAPRGSPLLPNLGKASASEYLMDISMMAVLNAKERTLRELSALALSAGWKITRMTRAQGSLWAYTTAEPV